MRLSNSKSIPASALASAALFLIISIDSAKAAAADLVVPAYFYPSTTGSDWDKLNVTAARTPTTAIMNPNSGPGVTKDPNYVRAVENLHLAGGKVVAYVSTVYSTRNINDVTNDILKYATFYKVDGFFIDEMTSDSGLYNSHILYYQSIYNFIKGLSRAYQVVGNPGTNTEEVYARLPLADKLVMFESNNNIYSSYAQSGWQSNYPSKRFINIVYDVPQSAVQNVLQHAVSNNVGGIFITSGNGSNPYSALPSYLNSLAFVPK